ncbi:chemotaxis protein [Helicobacter apodemus]|uniref:Chemotaxis protein n=1 Tax=Helicobacter apodemus TaxID=135569 RepID=A0A2U8FAU5_9HELI|nr:chemotaxis protein [Helicobacter apodemus]AWI33353.1 chemotaxis protein [Helicobacter apodemus]
MTQEELDALLNDGASEQQIQEDIQPDTEELPQKDEMPSKFRIEQDTLWPPPPPNAEHKVIHQLDDVTQDSEAKASQTFDKLEVINNAGEVIEESLSEFEKFINSQEEMLQKLHKKFPDFHTFSQKLEEIQHIKEVLKTITNNIQDISNAALEAMDIMQYQDIHRQKIERVINVMRSLAKYMNSLFESKIDDSKRVSSAVHIEGDNTENVLNEEDIEKLVSSLSNNQ